MNDLLDELYYKGPRQFTKRRIAREGNLFAVRAALVYTPTSHIPATWIGKGRFDVWLPLAIPTLQEFLAARGNLFACGSICFRGQQGRFGGGPISPPACTSFASTLQSTPTTTSA
jgi:hypothetical protein